MLGCCFVEIILVFVILTSVILTLFHKQQLEQKKKSGSIKEYFCFCVMIEYWNIKSALLLSGKLSHRPETLTIYMVGFKENS